MKLGFESGPGAPPQPENEDRLVNFRLSPEDFECAKEFRAGETEEVLKELQEKRVELTPRQEKLVARANEEIVEVLRGYGLELPARAAGQTDIIALESRHYKEILDLDPGKKTPDTLGVYLSEEDRALLWYKKSVWSDDGRNQEFLHTVSHELLHAKSYRALQAYCGKDGPDVGSYRSGLHLIKLGGAEESAFFGLNEAITETLASEATNRIINSDREEFREVILRQIYYEADRADRVRKTKDPRTAAMQEMMRADGWERGSYPGKDWLSAFVDRHYDDFEYAYPETYRAYPKERRMFEALVRTLAEKSEEYKGRERDIRALFYKAYLTGQMLPVGRLVEKTLGKGSLRLVAEKFLSEDMEKLLEGT